MAPSENDPICPITFEETRIRLGGGPDDRTSFWKAYRDELAYNQRTKYQNTRLAICRPMLVHLKDQLDKTFYYRKGELVAIAETPRSTSHH